MPQHQPKPSCGLPFAARRRTRHRHAITSPRTQPIVTLILGGARSGKSRHAEHLTTANDPPWLYIATAQPFDEEMRARIAGHQARRTPGWQTIEAPIDLADTIAAYPNHPILIDCLTLWLTNLTLAQHDIASAIEALETTLTTRHAPTFIVSNELGLGIVPQTPLGRSFRDAAGLLNQRIAACADQVFFMIAGLPMKLK